jgi:hypothetical protein
MRYLNHLAFAILFFGCSIIDDTDIQARDELAALNFTGFNIEGSGSSIASTMTLDTPVELHDEVYNKDIKRMKLFTVPQMSGKMKYKSGITSTSDLEFYTLYLENDVPYTWILRVKDSDPIEIYRFRYDENGRLFRIITLIHAMGDGGTEVATQDDITYNEDGNISTIVRQSNIAGQEGTFTDFLISNGDEPRTLNSFKFQNINVTSSIGDCSETYNCQSYQTNYTSGPGVSINIKAAAAFGTTAKVILSEDDGGNCCRDEDTYYFHPLMMWQGAIKNGHILLPIYLVDWLMPGAQINGGINSSSQPITIHYNYEH